MLEYNNIQTKCPGADFTLAIGCRLNCHYCPQDKLISKYVGLYDKEELFMKFDTFVKCLKKFEHGAGISFGGMVEPFHNKECTKMIKYAYGQGHKIWLSTTLVGASEEDFEVLKEVRFDDIQLHIPDQNGNSNFVITDEYLKVFKKFHDFFMDNGNLTYSCHGEIHDEIKPYLNSDVMCANFMMNRAGNLDYEDLLTYDRKGKIVCGCGSVSQKSGWSPIILPNGTVLLCCMDYGMEHILGNIVLQEWNEILCGKEYLRYLHGLEDDNVPLLCRKCPEAHPADVSSSYKNLLAPNVNKIIKLLKNYMRGGVSEFALKETFSTRSIYIIKMLAKYAGEGNLCIFGLGKLFHDNYYPSLWNNLIRANIFSDNNKEKWGQEIRGIKCVPPSELMKYEDLLVITYVTDDSEIQKQLKQLGIKNIINMYEIYNLFDNKF